MYAVLHMRLALAFLVPMLATGTTPRIVVQTSDPELTVFARELVPLCEEWYPKIAEILYGSNPPNPPAEIRIAFDEAGIAGRAEGNEIHLSTAEAKRSAKLDFRAVVIHELVHLVQSYPVPARCDGLRIVGCLLTQRHHFGPTWINEGIADYVTYTFFTGTNRPLLRLNSNGQLQGYDESIPYLYGLQSNKTSLHDAYAPRGVKAGKGYQHGYTVTASFLLWLERNKDKQIVRKLNAAMRTNSYRDGIWRQMLLASVDQLWAEFLGASKQAH